MRVKVADDKPAAVKIDNQGWVDGLAWPIDPDRRLAPDVCSVRSSIDAIYGPFAPPVWVSLKTRPDL